MFDSSSMPLESKGLAVRVPLVTGARQTVCINLFSSTGVDWCVIMANLTNPTGSHNAARIVNFTNRDVRWLVPRHCRILPQWQTCQHALSWPRLHVTAGPRQTYSQQLQTPQGLAVQTACMQSS